MRLLVKARSGDTEIEAAVAQDVDGGRVLRQVNRVVERKHAPEDADANPSRARGDRRGDRERRGAEQAAVPKVPLGEHDAFEAERLGLVGLAEHVGVRLAARPHQEQPCAQRSTSDSSGNGCGSGSVGRTSSTNRRIDARHCSWSSVK